MKRLEWSNLEDGNPSTLDNLHDFLVRLDQLNADAPALDGDSVSVALSGIITGFINSLPEECQPYIDAIERTLEISRAP